MVHVLYHNLPRHDFHGLVFSIASLDGEAVFAHDRSSDRIEFGMNFQELVVSAAMIVQLHDVAHSYVVRLIIVRLTSGVDIEISISYDAESVEVVGIFVWRARGRVQRFKAASVEREQHALLRLAEIVGHLHSITLEVPTAGRRHHHGAFSRDAVSFWMTIVEEMLVD